MATSPISISTLAFGNKASFFSKETLNKPVSFVRLVFSQPVTSIRSRFFPVADPLRRSLAINVPARRGLSRHPEQEFFPQQIQVHERAHRE